MKRTFYFLKDSVTGNFYDGGNCDDIGQFDKAAVYFQRKNAEKRMKSLFDQEHAGSWTWYVHWIKNPEYLWYVEENERTQHINKWITLIDERKHLPNWGIEIVAVEVEA